MSRTHLVLFAAAMLVGTTAAAQTPQEHLENARRLLHDAAVPSDAATAERVAALHRDFNEFASDYLLQNRAATPADADGAERQPDWRTRYLQVEADLTALLGAPDAAGAKAPAAATLDPQLRDRLQQIRTNLQTFYAATIQARDGNPVAHTGPASNQAVPVPPAAPAPQTPASVRTGTAAPQPPPPGGSVPANPPAAPPAPAATESRPDAPDPSAGRPTTSAATSAVGVCAPALGGIEPSTAVQLLDRIQSILDASTKDDSPAAVAPVGTSGTKNARSAPASGKVTIDRALVDEIRAEVVQIRALLKP